MWFSSSWREPGLTGLIVAFAVTALAGALMVSRFNYDSFKQVNLGGRVPFAYIAIVPLGYALIAFHPPVVLFILFSAYALSGPTVWLYRRLRRRQRGPDGGGAPAAGAPGPVATPGAHSVIDEAGWEARRQRTPLRRLATAEEVAAAAVFLASDEARSIAGVTLKIDGAITVAGP